MLLLPQIPTFAAEDLARTCGGMTIAEARAARTTEHHLKVFSPTGGTHITDERLLQVRDGLEIIARSHGYPQLKKAHEFGGFDREAADHLHRNLRISANEASKAGPWLFLACVLMPDIVLWRQRRVEGAAVNSDNFLDSTNNLLRRLWWRAVIFHDPARPVDTLWLLDHLLEDAVQTFYERRSLSGTPRMGLAFGKVYHAATQLLPPKFNMEPVERTAQKLLVRIGENVAYDSLDERQLVQIIAESFHRSIPAEHAESVSVAHLVRIIIPMTPAVHTPVPIPAPTTTMVGKIEATAPAAVEFNTIFLKVFGADRGTYSVVTNREAEASEINLTGPEAKIAEAYFGRERIHSGPVKNNPEAARQRFRLHPTGELIYLNLVYPKQDRTEMRLYLSKIGGFKPLGGSIWFLFQRKSDLFIGFMTADEWKNQTASQENRGDTDN